MPATLCSHEVKQIALANYWKVKLLCIMSSPVPLLFALTSFNDSKPRQILFYIENINVFRSRVFKYYNHFIFYCTLNVKMTTTFTVIYYFKCHNFEIIHHKQNLYIAILKLEGAKLPLSGSLAPSTSKGRYTWHWTKTFIRNQSNWISDTNITRFNR